MAEHTNLIDKQVGSRVRALRKEAGVSLRGAALAIQVTLEYYQCLEAGEKRFKAQQLLALASKFGVMGSAFFEEVSAPVFQRSREIKIAPLAGMLN